MLRQDRSPANSNKKSGGGVLLAVRSSIKCRLLSPPESASMEQLWVAIPCCNATVHLCVVYFPPDRVSDEFLIDKHINSLNWIISNLQANDTIVILGDFNLSGTCWQSDSLGSFYPNTSLSSMHSVSRKLLDAYCTAGLRQMNGVHNEHNRLLDLCFVSEEMCSESSITQAPSPLVKLNRHHVPIHMIFTKYSVPQLCDTNESIYYNFKNANFDCMNDFLSRVNWNEVLQDSSTNTAASTVSNIVMYAVDQYVPIKKKRSILKPAWSNANLRHLRNAKRAALRRYSKYRSDSTRIKYVEANRQYKNLNCHLYNAYQRKLQDKLKTDPKHFWSYVNEQRKENGLPSHMTNGSLEADSIPEIAELFCAQFSSVFVNESLDIEDIAAATRNITQHSTFSTQLFITEDMILWAAKKIKNSTGMGPDGIPSLVLKKCINTLAKPLSTVFNMSLTTGVFPDCWKESFVFPVFKKGCKQNVSNYRGIAALSAVSKLFEVIVLDNLIWNYAGYISPNQHGFMAKRSTTTNLTMFTSFLVREIEMGHQVDAIYTDLSAAFDKMNHAIAIAKLDRLGVDNNLLRWLQSYLTGRRMSVKIGDHTSSSFAVPSGVPQGSHLGPFLFLLYMNDVNMCVNCSTLSYADDLKIYSPITDPKDAHLLQQQLEIFATWCKTNRMLLNVSKCSVISFCRKRSIIDYDYTLDNISLKRDTKIKDLGVLIDNKLTFKEHVSYIVSKASSQLGFIFRFAKQFKDIYCLKTLYCSLVRPILEYSSVVWSPYYGNEVHRIERIQRKFIRFALRFLRWQNPLNLPCYEERCRLINLELLKNRRNLAQACFICDLLQTNIDCPSLLSRLDINTRRRNLRAHSFLNVRSARTNYGLNEPIRRMCCVFNSCYEVFDFDVSRVKNKNSFRRILC